MQRSEKERKDRDEQRKIKQLQEEKERKDREEQLKIRLVKNEEARRKIEDANSKIDQTFAQIIKVNPCMKAAIEDINRAVYSADSDDVRKTIFKLESEKESLQNYKRNLTVNSDTTVGQLENVNNRLQAINYELDTLNDYQKSNNEYDKKMNELNNAINEYNKKSKECEDTAKACSIFAFFAGLAVGVFLTFTY